MKLTHHIVRTERGRRLVIRNQASPEDQKKIADAYLDLYNDLLKFSRLIRTDQVQEVKNDVI